MRLVEVKLSNFRGYANETSIEIDPLTVLIGRNDAGKSSVLDALDIYFNDSQIERDDCCVRTDCDDVTITCVFDSLPKTLVIDDQHPTSLSAEYLLRDDGKLEIAKIFNCAALKGKLGKIVARANHPSTPGVHDLIGLKIAELKKRARDNGVELGGTNETVKAQLRAAIWAHAADLALAEREVDLTKESGQDIWEQIKTHLPVFALFKSDRASTDQDAEAQDPLKAAVKEAIRRREVELGNVVSEIRRELELVAARTVDKIREMSPDLANQLRPAVKNKNWDSLFTVTLTGDDDIPINKRGSGTRRLVLLNFFRAKAEDASENRGTGVIYAVEEPETSQHPNHQIMLLEAFEDLVEQSRCQVILTTHTPTLARRVSADALRLVALSADGVPFVESGRTDATRRKIKDSLGVLADHDIKVFLGVEGKHDISFLRHMSSMLASVEPDIPDLDAAERAGLLMFIPLSGSNMELWVTRLAGLGRPEFYLTDHDERPPARPRYHRQIAEWTARGCIAWATSKRELENYLHPAVLIAEEPGYPGTGADDFESVPMLFAQAAHRAAPNAPDWDTLGEEQRKDKASRAKKRLNTTCAQRMTPSLLSESDPNGDIRSWLRAIGERLNA